MHKKYWLLGILWMPLIGAAQVQTLKEAAQQAVVSNPEVLSRWHTYEAAIGERDVASGGYLPRLDLVAAYGRDRRDDPILQQNLNRHSTTLTLTQMLYDGFATRNDVNRLDHARQARLFELFDVTESVTLEVARAYFDVLRFRALLTIAEDNYVRHRSVFEQIQRKAAAGVGRRVDLEQAAGRLALTESNLLTETSNLHDVSARFQRLVGSPPRKDMEEPIALSKDVPPNMAAALQAATRRHPALLAAIENVRSAQSSARLRDAAYQPRFDFRLRSERGSNLGSEEGSTNNNTAEVVMSWNLFNGFADKARGRQYAEQLNVTRDLRDKACRDLRQTLVIAYNDTTKLIEQLNYLDQHQLSIEKARDAYRKQFDIGQRTLLDVLDTENELFQAKRAYINAEYDLKTAYARTHAGIGTLFTTLGLSRADMDVAAPPGILDDAAAVDRCPAEGPSTYTVDKAALDARAQELVKEATLLAAERSANAVALPSVTPGAADPAAVQKSVLDALAAWATAWTNREVAAYLDAYAPAFVPVNGTTHEAWEAQRRATLLAAREIKLDIGEPRLVVRDSRHATTEFRQQYRSAVHQDVVRKTLDWEHIDGRWKIVREVAEPATR